MKKAEGYVGLSIFFIEERDEIVEWALDQKSLNLGEVCHVHVLSLIIVPSDM